MSLFWKCAKCKRKKMFFVGDYNGLCYQCEQERIVEIETQMAAEKAEKLCRIDSICKELFDSIQKSKNAYKSDVSENEIISNNIIHSVDIIDRITESPDFELIKKHFEEFYYPKLDYFYKHTADFERKYLNESNLFIGIKRDLNSEEFRIKDRIRRLKLPEKRKEEIEKALDDLKYSNITLTDPAEPTDNSNKEYSLTTLSARNKIYNLYDYTVIDVETTGLNSVKNEIIQLSAVRFENFLPCDCWVSYIKPHKGLKKDAESINNIHEYMLSDAPFKEQVYKSFNDFMDNNLPIIGYNVSFDMRFLLNQGFNILKRKHQIFDVYSIAKENISKADCYDYKLSSVTHALGYDYINNFHDALADCIATGLIFADMVNFKAYGETTTGFRSH